MKAVVILKNGNVTEKLHFDDEEAMQKYVNSMTSGMKKLQNVGMDN